MDGKKTKKKAVGELIAKLQSLHTMPGPSRYWNDEGKRAVKALVEIGPSVVPDLIKALKHDDNSLNYGRAWAARALGEIGDLRAVPALIKAIKNLTDEVGAEAVWALGRLEDPRVVPALIPALTRVAGLRWLLGKEALTYLQVNEAAAVVLGRLRDPQAVPALIQVLQDRNSDWRVRQKAMGALRAIGDKRAVPALTEILQDKSLYFVLRHNAAEALETLGDRQAVPALLQALQNEGVFHEGIVPTSIIPASKVSSPTQGQTPALVRILRDETRSEWEREEAIEALGVAKSPQLAAALAELLNDETADPWVCEKAIDVLGAMRTPQAVLILIEALAGESTEWQSARALEKIGASAVPALVVALKHPSREVRVDATEVLGVIKDPQAVPALAEILNAGEKDWLIRGHAAEALGLIGDPSAVPALIKALQDVPLLAASLQNASLLAESLNFNDLYVCKSAAEGLQVIMQHYSDLDLRAALPALRRLRMGDPVFQEVLDQIESVTAASKSLPLPAAAPPLDVQTLPRPADVPLSASKGLRQGFWTRLRRKLRPST